MTKNQDSGFVALGFIVDNRMLCCVCAEKLAKESYRPHLWYVCNKVSRMPNKCECGRYPDCMECQDAALRITKDLNRSTQQRRKKNAH